MKQAKSTALLQNGWMILAVIVLVAILLSINWYYYHLTKRNLDENLSARLQAVASLVSSRLSPDDINGTPGGEYIPSIHETTVARFHSMSRYFSLSNILVVREDGTTLLSLNPDLFPPGEIYPNWNMDYTAIIRALEGSPSSTNLYRAPDGTFLKAGYAPVPLEGSAGAVVAVEASADFLAGVENLRTILLAVTALSAAGIALFTWFVLKATGSLIQARESLLRTETLAAMGRMAAGIAHEIRNPLFIIRSSAEKLRENRPQDAADIDSYIIEEVDRLNGILTDYLLFAKDEPAKKNKMDLATTLRRSISLVGDTTHAQAIEMVQRFEIHEAPFWGDEKKLQQSFLNVLLNAIQAMKDGGRLTVSLSLAGNRYVATFADAGTGIPAKEIKKVMEPFYTTKTGGSGLGLAIVKKIVEDHDGRIEMRSELGRGTEVEISLPVRNQTGDDND